MILSFCMVVSLAAAAQQPEGKASIVAPKQMKEGRIIYERTMQMPVRSFGNVDPEIAARLPKSRTDQYELLFGNNQSLWQMLPSATEGDGFNGPGMSIRFGGMNDVSYYNFEKGMRTDQREVMDRSFLILDTIRKGEWKLTEETRPILNYVARKATSSRPYTRSQMTMENGEMKRTMVNDTMKIVAWFTTDIPVPVGPEAQGQLPGAVLELEMNNGQTVYKAVEVSPKVSLSRIKEPKDGKRVTMAEFQQENEKIMAEMRRNMPRGGTDRVIIRN